MTTSELAKLKFDPNLYRVNAYQGLAYDPMRKSSSYQIRDERIDQQLLYDHRPSASWARLQYSGGAREDEG